jgi:hypothetical protein
LASPLPISQQALAKATFRRSRICSAYLLRIPNVSDLELRKVISSSYQKRGVQ